MGVHEFKSRFAPQHGPVLNRAVAPRKGAKQAKYWRLAALLLGAVMTVVWVTVTGWLGLRLLLWLFGE